MTFQEFVEQYVGKYATDKNLQKNILTVQLAYNAWKYPPLMGSPKLMKAALEEDLDDGNKKSHCLNAVYELIYFHRRWNAGLTHDPKHEWVVGAIAQQGGTNIEVCTPITPLQVDATDPGEFVLPEGVTMTRKGPNVTFDGLPLQDPEVRANLMDDYRAHRMQKSAFKKTLKASRAG